MVAVGGDLEPGTLLAAYRAGIFPMPSERRRPPILWFSPVRRGVVPLDGLVVSRSLRRSTRRFEIRVDTAFEAVVAACADPDQVVLDLARVGEDPRRGRGLDRHLRILAAWVSRSRQRAR